MWAGSILGAWQKSTQCQSLSRTESDSNSDSKLQFGSLVCLSTSWGCTWIMKQGECHLQQPLLRGTCPSLQSCVGTNVLLQTERSGPWTLLMRGYWLAGSGHQGSPEFSREKGMAHWLLHTHLKARVNLPHFGWKLLNWHSLKLDDVDDTSKTDISPKLYISREKK